MSEEKNREGRPNKFTSVEFLQMQIDAYFDKCNAEKRPFTVTGLALFLDTSRETITDYEKKDEFSDTIKRAKNRILQQKEEMLCKTAGQVAGVIFDLKNNYPQHYKDKIEQEITGNQNINVTIIRK